MTVQERNVSFDFSTYQDDWFDTGYIDFLRQQEWYDATMEKQLKELRQFKGAYSDDVLLKDTYTIQNHSSAEETAVLVYPFVSNISEISERRPELFLNCRQAQCPAICQNQDRRSGHSFTKLKQQPYDFLVLQKWFASRNCDMGGIFRNKINRLVPLLPDTAAAASAQIFAHGTHNTIGVTLFSDKEADIIFCNRNQAHDVIHLTPIDIIHSR